MQDLDQSIAYHLMVSTSCTLHNFLKEMVISPESKPMCDSNLGIMTSDLESNPLRFTEMYRLQVVPGETLMSYGEHGSISRRFVSRSGRNL